MLQLRLNNYCCQNNWKPKHVERDGKKIKKLINLPGQFRPMHNLKSGKFYNQGNYSEAFDDLSQSLCYSNVFKARPIKHWRKQSGNYDNQQSFRNLTQMKDYHTPGGYTTYEIIVSDDEPVDTCCGFKDQKGEENIPNKNNNWCGNNNNSCVGNVIGQIDNKIMTKDPECLSSKNNEKEYVIDKNTCQVIKVCKKTDIPTQALARVRFSNNNLRKACGNNYSSYNEYHYARCMNYDQNLSKQSSCQYACSNKCSVKDNNGDPSKCCDCGCPNQTVADDTTKKAFIGSNDYDKNVFQTINLNSTICKNRAVVKPNNQQFWQQGATSSSNRLLRLKTNTINKNAVSIGKKFGSESTSALNYNARSDSSFINKSKVAPKFPNNNVYIYRTNKKLYNGQQACNPNYCNVK